MSSLSPLSRTQSTGVEPRFDYRETLASETYHWAYYTPCLSYDPLSLRILFVLHEPEVSDSIMIAVGFASGFVSGMSWCGEARPVICKAIDPLVTTRSVNLQSWAHVQIRLSWFEELLLTIGSSSTQQRFVETRVSQRVILLRFYCYLCCGLGIEEEQLQCATQRYSGGLK